MKSDEGHAMKTDHNEINKENKEKKCTRRTKASKENEGRGRVKGLRGPMRAPRSN